MQYSQEHLKTMVYAKFGGQTECIMENSKIEEFFLWVKFLFLICRSFQVYKKSSWEFVAELSNTTCVLNFEKQGHEKK